MAESTNVPSEVEPATEARQVGQARDHEALSGSIMTSQIVVQFEDAAFLSAARGFVTAELHQACLEADAAHAVLAKDALLPGCMAIANKTLRAADEGCADMAASMGYTCLTVWQEAADVVCWVRHGGDASFEDWAEQMQASGSALLGETVGGEAQVAREKRDKSMAAMSHNWSRCVQTFCGVYGTTVKLAALARLVTNPSLQG